MYQIIYQIKAYDKTKTMVKNPIMISAFIKEILPFKDFKFLAIHANIFNVICGPK